MGQITIGILFGVQAPEGVELYSDDSESGLLERWYDRNAAAIAARRQWIDRRCMSVPGTMPWQFESGEQRIVPDLETETETPMLGFWVAAGASGKSGLPYLGAAVPLSAIRTTEPYARAYRNARRRWWRFVRWARTQGVELPRPRLWITQTEVA